MKVKKQEWRKLNKNQKLEEKKNFLIFTYIFSSADARGASLHLHTRQPETVKKCDQIFLIYWLIKSN